MCCVYLAVVVVCVYVCVWWWWWGGLIVQQMSTYGGMLGAEVKPTRVCRPPPGPRPVRRIARAKQAPRPPAPAPQLTPRPLCPCAARQVDGDLWTTAKFIDGVRLPYIAPSLGGVESLIEQPTVVSYWDQGPEKRAQVGVPTACVCVIVVGWWPGGGEGPCRCMPRAAGPPLLWCWLLPSTAGTPPLSCQVGIRDNLVRFSCGVEAVEDLWADFAQSFDQL